METELFHDAGQIKKEKDIYYHGLKHILIICHLPDPHSFSLPTTFKWTGRSQAAKQGCKAVL
jgi:hypothetical protein